MDVGVCDTEDAHWEDYDCQPCDVNMLGKCYTCGGTGHPARMCPTKGGGEKGLGKGFGGKGFGKQQSPGGKGYGGKGFSGGAGFNREQPKGFGKGYQGNCFNCGKRGHKSAECRSRPANLVESEGDGQEPAETETR